MGVFHDYEVATADYDEDCHLDDGCQAQEDGQHIEGHNGTDIDVLWHLAL